MTAIVVKCWSNCWRRPVLINQGEWLVGRPLPVATDLMKRLMEQVRGLFKGMSSPMASVALINAMIFGVYGNVQRRMENPDSFASHAFAGSVAGAIQSLVCSPMELVKTRIQIQEQICPSGSQLYKYCNPTISFAAFALFGGRFKIVWRQDSIWIFFYKGIYRGFQHYWKWLIVQIVPAIFDIDMNYWATCPLHSNHDNG